jgi:hypothetical protein
MSLNFNFSKVANHEEVTIDPNNPENWHPVADALVWLSLHCGYAEITLKNVDKVIARIMAYQAVAGAFLRHDGAPLYIMPADIRRFVGMRTNVTPLTEAQWLRRLGAIAHDGGASLRRKLENGQYTPALQVVAATAQAA